MSEENVEIVRSICTPWENGDFSSVEWADPDIAFCDAQGRESRGLDEMSSLWRDWLSAWEDWASLPEEFLDAGHRVLVLTRFRGRGKGSGAPNQDFPGACLFTLSKSKVVRLVLYTDREEALEAAGLSE